MGNLRFSIVVPTRNRFETLKYCLQTCLLQGSFDNYEIIVSDNSDELESKETRKTVDELQSVKIKYFKTASILSMTANYEFALSKCTGEYILCIGDDDGVLPDSLIYVNELIKKFDASVIKSPVVVYHWKNSLLAPNTLELPYPRPVTSIDSRSILEKVARFELGYYNLPMIYYSFVAKKIIDKVVAEQESFFGNAASIDMYSGLIIAYKTKNYILSDRAFIISGVSSKSNGAAEQKSLNNNVSTEHYTKTDLHKMYQKYKVPHLQNYNLQLLSLLELLKFKSNFKVDDKDLQVNPKKVMVKLLSNTPVINKKTDIGLAESFLEYDLYKDAINDIKNTFLGKELYFPYLGNNDIQIVSHTSVNPDLFNIENVFDAAVIVKKMIDGYESVQPVSITISGKTDLKSSKLKPGLIKKIYKRIKRAGKVLLIGHE